MARPHEHAPDHSHAPEAGEAALRRHGSAPDPPAPPDLGRRRGRARRPPERPGRHRPRPRARAVGHPVDRLSHARRARRRRARAAHRPRRGPRLLRARLRAPPPSPRLRALRRGAPRPRRRPRRPARARQGRQRLPARPSRADALRRVPGVPDARDSVYDHDRRRPDEPGRLLRAARLADRSREAPRPLPAAGPRPRAVARRPGFLEEAQDDATLLAIRDQERAGLDIVTDGEMRRESYSNRFANALTGSTSTTRARRSTAAGTRTRSRGWSAPIERRHPVQVARSRVPQGQHGAGRSR